MSLSYRPANEQNKKSKKNTVLIVAFVILPMVCLITWFNSVTFSPKSFESYSMSLNELRRSKITILNATKIRKDGSTFYIIEFVPSRFPFTKCPVAVYDNKGNLIDKTFSSDNEKFVKFWYSELSGGEPINIREIKLR